MKFEYNDKFLILKNIAIIVITIIVVYCIYNFYIEYTDMKKDLSVCKYELQEKSKIIVKYRKETEHLQAIVFDYENQIKELKSNKSFADSVIDGTFSFKESSSSNSHEISNETYTVYITDKGSKYHSKGCSYLKSSNPISKKDAINQGYSACSRCNP